MVFRKTHWLSLIGRVTSPNPEVIGQALKVHKIGFDVFFPGPRQVGAMLCLSNTAAKKLLAR